MWLVNILYVIYMYVYICVCVCVPLKFWKKVDVYKKLWWLIKFGNLKILMNFNNITIKVKVPCNRLESPESGRDIALHPLDFGTTIRWVVTTTLRPLYPTGKTRYPLYRRLGVTQCQSGHMRKISPLPGFDPQTVQLVTSHYTNWAIPAPNNITTP
jgi:hypothetical protein